MLSGSNAIDAVNNCTALSTGTNSGFSNGDPVDVDQRSYLRNDGQCDIGAYEYGASPAASSPASPPKMVPTLPQWGLALMSVLLGVVGFFGLRRRQI